MELFEKLRRDNRDLGLGIRALAEKYHVHRRVVRQALVSAVPPVRKAPELGRRGALVAQGRQDVVDQRARGASCRPRG